ncbi:MAG: hypothetical protein JNK82_36125 [Myxococcaceae bacterium]|nr:hypothetical protein [Myxococcaceae bacterium]
MMALLFIACPSPKKETGPQPLKDLPACPMVCVPGTKCIRSAIDAVCMKECTQDSDCDTEVGERCFTGTVAPMVGDRLHNLCMTKNPLGGSWPNR